MARSRWLLLLVVLALVGVGFVVLRFARAPAPPLRAPLAVNQEGIAPSKPDLLYSLEFTPSNRISPPANARVILALWSDGTVIGYVGGAYRSGQIGAARLAEIRDSLAAHSVGLTQGNHFPPDSSWYELRVGDGQGTRVRTAWNLRSEYLPGNSAGAFSAAWSGVTTEMTLLFDALDAQLADDETLQARAGAQFPSIR